MVKIKNNQGVEKEVTEEFAKAYRKAKQRSALLGYDFGKNNEIPIEEFEEDEIEKSEENELKGGKADNLSLKDIAEKHKVSVEEIKKQLKAGMDVEMEHTDEPSKAMEIAMDHLTESASYYTELAKMESKF